MPLTALVEVPGPKIHFFPKIRALSYAEMTVWDIRPWETGQIVAPPYGRHSAGCPSEKSEKSPDQVLFSHLDKCLLGTCASDWIGTCSSTIPDCSLLLSISFHMLHSSSKVNINENCIWIREKKEASQTAPPFLVINSPFDTVFCFHFLSFFSGQLIWAVSI